MIHTCRYISPDDPVRQEFNVDRETPMLEYQSPVKVKHLVGFAVRLLVSLPDGMAPGAKLVQVVEGDSLTESQRLHRARVFRNTTPEMYVEATWLPDGTRQCRAVGLEHARNVGDAKDVVRGLKVIQRFRSGRKPELITEDRRKRERTETVIEALQQGHSLRWCARMLQQPESTLRGWVDRYARELGFSKDEIDELPLEDS